MFNDNDDIKHDVMIKTNDSLIKGINQYLLDKEKDNIILSFLKKCPNVIDSGKEIGKKHVYYVRLNKIYDFNANIRRLKHQYGIKLKCVNIIDNMFVYKLIL